MTREEMLKDKDEAERAIGQKQKEVGDLQVQMLRLSGIVEYLDGNLKENESDNS